MKILENLQDLYRSPKIFESKELIRMKTAFTNYRVNPLLSYFSQADLRDIYELSCKPSMHNDPKLHCNYLREIMDARGFKIIGGGTNRRAYENIYDPRVVAKVALGGTGRHDNLIDMSNQNILMPFCNKGFEVTPLGSLQLCERVIPFKTVDEFKKYINEIADILVYFIRANDIAMDDIGMRSFKNWGYRENFGPVLLDYSSMYIADPNKRRCTKVINDRVCRGAIDYDDKFNKIICTECGTEYLAQSIAKKNEDGSYVGGFLTEKTKNSGGTRKMAIIVRNSNGEIVGKTDKKIGTSNYANQSLSNNSYVAEDKSFKRMNLRTYDEKGNSVKRQVEEEQPVVAEVVEETKKNFVQKQTATGSIEDRVINGITEVVYGKVDNIPSMYSTQPEFMTKEDAINMYSDLSVITLDDGGFAYMEDPSTSKDSYINTILSDIFGDKYVAHADTVFWTLVNNVKGTIHFFKTLISYWNTMIKERAFMTDETSDGTSYCIVYDIFNLYHRTIVKALDDYKFQVMANNCYNTSNIMSIINTTMSDIEAFDDDDYYDYDKCLEDYVQIESSNKIVKIIHICEIEDDEDDLIDPDYISKSIEIDGEFDRALVDEIDEEEDVVIYADEVVAEEEEKLEEKEDQPVIVQDTEPNYASKKQQNRYSKKNKKHRRR